MSNRTICVQFVVSAPRSCLFAVLLFVLLAFPRAAAAAPPIFVGNGTPDSCTSDAVHDALSLAETSGGGTIRFRCGDAPVTIPISPEPDPDWEVIALDLPNNTTVDGGGLITFERMDGIFLVRPGTTAALKNLRIGSGAHFFDPRRVLMNLGSLTLETVELFHNLFGAIDNDGTLTITKSLVIGGVFDSPVGPLIVNRGTMTVDHSTFRDHLNSALIRNFGTLDVNASVFTNNLCTLCSGGAVLNEGHLTVSNSDFSSNAGVQGGAIFSPGNPIVITGSTFSDNFSNHGGAIAVGGGTIENCRFLNNRSKAGVLAGSGGAIWAELSETPLTIKNSTFSGNSAARAGGAIYVAGAVTISNSTITDNVANFEGGGIYVAGEMWPVLIRTTVSRNMPDDIASVVR